MNLVKTILQLIRDGFFHPGISFSEAEWNATAAVMRTIDLRDHFKTATAIINECFSCGENLLLGEPDSRLSRWDAFRSVVTDLLNEDKPTRWEEVLRPYEGDDDELLKEVKLMQAWLKPYFVRPKDENQGAEPE